jgi:hypothetical protein
LLFKETVSVYSENHTEHTDNSVEVEFEVKLRPTVSRPVHLGVRFLSGTRDQLFFLLENFITQFRVCYFIVPILETPSTWRARSPKLYPPGTGCPRYTPGHWAPFPSPLNDLQGYGGGILTRLHTRDNIVKVKVTLRPTISKPVRRGVRRPSGPATNSSFSPRLSCRQLRFAIL